VQAVNVINSNVFRPLFVGINPGFQSYNFFRDFIRFWKNFNSKEGKGISLGRAIARYKQAIPLARVRAFGLPENPTQAQKDAWSDLTEAEKARIFSIPFSDFFGKPRFEETQIEDIMVRTGARKGKGPPRSATMQRLVNAKEWVKNVGDFIETLPKAAAMYEMISDGREISDLMPSERSQIRQNIGSPDYLAGGTYKPFYNELFLFSNAIMQAIRSDYNVVTDPKTRSGWMWKTAALNVAPKMLMAGILMGLMPGALGGFLRRLLERVSEYDKTNYLIIPMPPFFDEKGNAVYMRFPQDDTGRLVGGIVWKTLRLLKGDKGVEKTLSGMLDYTFGQAPSLTPAFGALWDGKTMVSGQNPYDEFRQRNLFTDDEMKAGGINNWMKFFGWEFQQMGGATWAGKWTSDKRSQDQTWAQWALDAPFGISNTFGRWIRITDYGLTEGMNELTSSTEQDEARRRIRQREAVTDAIREYGQFSPAERMGGAGMGKRFGMARKIVQNIYADKDRAEQTRRTNEIQKAINAGMMKGSSDPVVEKLLNSDTNQQKTVVLREVLKSMAPPVRSGYLDRLASSGVISRELSLSIKRESARP
jgi:hypothetical protein